MVCVSVPVEMRAKNHREVCVDATAQVPLPSNCQTKPRENARQIWEKFSRISSAEDVKWSNLMRKAFKNAFKKPEIKFEDYFAREEKGRMNCRYLTTHVKLLEPLWIISYLPPPPCFYQVRVLKASLKVFLWSGNVRNVRTNQTKTKN